MNAQEYLAKKRSLAHFVTLEKSPAYADLAAEIDRKLGECMKGLRNKQSTIEDVRGYQAAADALEGMKNFVGNRIEVLRSETSLSQEEIRQLGIETAEE